jgi:hypothetical protein
LLSSYDSSRKIKTNIPNDFFVSQQGINVNTFGGNPINRSVPGGMIVKSYTFDMSRYVQGIITRKDSSYTLFLSAPTYDSMRYTDPFPLTSAPATFYFQSSFTNFIAHGQVRLGGGGMHRENPLRMRMRIIYSRI